MFSVNIDITDQMKGFSKFAKQNDVNHAMNEILLICRKNHDAAKNGFVSDC